jgi:hypothetical protein
VRGWQRLGLPALTKPPELLWPWSAGCISRPVGAVKVLQAIDTVLRSADKSQVRQIPAAGGA